MFGSRGTGCSLQQKKAELLRNRGLRPGRRLLEEKTSRFRPEDVCHFKTFQIKKLLHCGVTSIPLGLASCGMTSERETATLKDWKMKSTISIKEKKKN